MAGNVFGSTSMQATPPDPGTHELWAFSLAVDLRARESAWASLAEDERSRAMRASEGVVRDRYVLRRHWLRLVLAGYLHVPAQEIRFRYGAFGKPRLAQPMPLHFNQSSTDDQTFVVVSSLPVGMDAERRGSLTDRELQQWSAHEAVTKAMGCGLGRDVDLDIECSDRPRIRRIGHDDPAEWSVSCLDWDVDTWVTVAARVLEPRLRLRSPRPALEPVQS